jgi:pyridoxine 5-phosphate synthase
MNQDRLKDVVATLRSNNIVVSLFIDPEINQVKASAKIGTDYVEFHTGKYCNSPDLNTQQDELHNLEAQVLAAAKLGLGVAAGHGLNYHNVFAIARIPQIEELNIGHSIISRAVLVGLERAVKEMVELMDAARKKD